MQHLKFSLGKTAILATAPTKFKKQGFQNVCAILGTLDCKLATLGIYLLNKWQGGSDAFGIPNQWQYADNALKMHFWSFVKPQKSNIKGLNF